MKTGFVDVGELLERDSELGLIDAALASARRGGGTALVFEGQAGIGKSALLDVAAQRAGESGLRVLRARGSALERDFGFGVALQLFEQPCADERAQLTRGGARLALPLLDGDAIAQPGADPFALIHGLYWLTANLADDGGAALIVDDLEWTDKPTLRFLNYLVQRIADLPVVLIAARGDGVALSDRPLIAELGALAAIEVRSLEPLGRVASAQLVGARLPAAGTALRHACALVTGGNPFLITELTDEIEARASRPTAAEVERLAPDALRRSVGARLARLPEGSFELARAVAVLGDEAPFAVVAELAGLNVDADAAVDALATAGILEADGRLAFAQTLVRATVYGEIPVGERAAMHARAADLLADAAMPPERVAIHVLQTRGVLSEAAFGALRQAARRAARRGAPEAAIPYLRRLLEERLDGSTRADALLALGTAEAHMLMPEAAGHLEQATNGGAGVRTRAEATAGLARLRIAAGAIEEGVGLLQDARAAVESLDPELALRLDAETTLAARFCLDTHGLMRSRMAAFSPPESMPSAGDRQMLALLAFDLTARGDAGVAEVVELAERALDGGRLLATEGPASAALSMALLTLRFAGRIDLADEVYSAAIDAARELGSARAFAAASFGRAAVARLQGRAADAEADARSALGLAGAAMMPEPVVVAELAFALAELDRLDEAVAELDRLGPPESDLCIVNPLLDARSQILAIAGRYDEALTAALRLGESADRWSETSPALYPWRSTAALLLARDGDGERAAQLVEEELALARAFGAPAPIGRALRAAARLTRSPSAMADAVSELERSESRRELVRALIDQGTMLRVAGQRREAREPLTRALGLAQETGLVACERQAREELLAAGARPRRAAVSSGAGALTPGERRVAELAARGRTNREIAQALFVTVKAVQYHLTNVYRKLGVTERAAIGAALER